MRRFGTSHYQFLIEDRDYPVNNQHTHQSQHGYVDMLTNRRSTMPVKHVRMPSWHAGSKTANPSALLAHNIDNVPRSLTPSILTSTTPSLPGYTTTRLIGAIHGTASLTHKVPKSFIKSLSSSIAGSWGEAKPLTQVLYQARDQAIERMTKDAIDKGANAVVGLQIRESEVMGCVVVSVSATACLVEKERGGVKRDSAQESPFG